MQEIKPKVFVSYAWTNDEYTSRVAYFVKRLRNDGIDTLFDQFDLQSGNSLNNFMEKCVSDPSVTHVLMLLNPAYKEKADKRSGGAGRETQIISEEVYGNYDQRKFIPVFMEPSRTLPTYLRAIFAVDLNDDNPDGYTDLIGEIFDVNKKPLLGPINYKLIERAKKL